VRGDAKAAAKLEADCDPSTIMAQAEHEPRTWKQFDRFEARFVKPLLEAKSLSELWLQPLHYELVTSNTSIAAVTAEATSTASRDAQQLLHLTAAVCLFDVQVDKVVLEGPQHRCPSSCAYHSNSGCYVDCGSHSCSTRWLRGWWLQTVRCACSHLSAAAQSADSTVSGKHRLEAVLHTSASPAPAPCCESVYIAAIAGTQLCVVAALPAAAIATSSSSSLVNDADCSAGCIALRGALPALQASAAHGVGDAAYLTVHDAAVLQPELRTQLQAVCARVELAFPSHDLLQQLASSGRVPSPFQLQPTAPAAPQQTRSKQQQQPYMHSGRTLKCSTALQGRAAGSAQLVPIITDAEAEAILVRSAGPLAVRLVAEHLVRRITEAALAATVLQSARSTAAKAGSQRLDCL
jgi:hypothetical protein